MKTAIIETPNLQRELEQMVASAPARANLLAANTKLESLRLQRNEASAALVALEKEASVGAAEMIERAKTLIKEGRAPTLITPDELRQARQAVRTIEGAIQIQEREARALTLCLAGEVRRALRPFRQRLVMRIAVALKELVAVAREDAEALSVIGKSGGDVTSVGYFPVPGLNVGGGAEGWLSDRRAEGYEV